MFGSNLPVQFLLLNLNTRDMISKTCYIIEYYIYALICILVTMTCTLPYNLEVYLILIRIRI